MTCPLGSPGSRRAPWVPLGPANRFPQPQETSSPSLRSWSKSSHATVPKRNFQFPSICFAICFVTNQFTTEVEALLTIQISIIFRRASFHTLRFSDLQIFDLKKISLGNLVLNYRRKKNKGVMWRPWTKRQVLRAISSTLKFQYFRKS